MANDGPEGCPVDVSILERGASAVERAEALLIGAGAGMGVDSGLPDFRGEDGFWRHYPPFEERNLDFYDLARPDWFRRDPELAWGFYGHRLHLYRQTDPHAGFDVLGRWGSRMEASPFVFTSNVDGHFQRVGVADGRVVECHGSIHHLQCRRPCNDEIWPADEIEVDLDEETFRAESALPTCPACDEVARPNVLMFGDHQWVPARTQSQQSRYRDWLGRIEDRPTVIVECGAGRAVPTVRHQCEEVARRTEGTLIRINPREPRAPADAISLAAGARETLEAIDSRLE